MVRSTEPYDPRVDRKTQLGFTANLGAQVLAGGGAARGLWGTFWEAVAGARAPGAAAKQKTRGVALQQVFFTGFQALPLVSAIAVFVGATTIIQTRLMAPAMPGEMVGKILVAAIVRELAPLVTAIVVAGRSGTAIATELGNMKANLEVLALSSLGIDPPRFVVWPRLIGSIVSVLVLTIYFAMIAILGGFLIASFISSPSFDSIRSGFQEALRPTDLFLFLAKGVGLGTTIGVVCCHYGLRVQTSPTEVPQAASRAVMLSLFSAVALNTAATVLFYWIEGPPISSPGFP